MIRSFFILQFLAAPRLQDILIDQEPRQNDGGKCHPQLMVHIVVVSVAESLQIPFAVI